MVIQHSMATEAAHIQLHELQFEQLHHQAHLKITLTTFQIVIRNSEEQRNRWDRTLQQTH